MFDMQIAMLPSEDGAGQRRWSSREEMRTALSGASDEQTDRHRVAHTSCGSMGLWFAVLVCAMLGSLLAMLLTASTAWRSDELGYSTQSCLWSHNTVAELSLPSLLVPPQTAVRAAAYVQQQAHTTADSDTSALDKRGLVAGWRVIASVFMGRRDRAHLVLAYLNSLQRQGLVDEIHLWDFSHSALDHQWLLAQRPALLATSTSFGYVHSMDLDSSCGSPSSPRRLDLRVSAVSDVHLLLGLSNGEQFELVLGAHLNQLCIFRRLGSDEPTWSYNLGLRLPAVEPRFTRVRLAHNGSHFAVQLGSHELTDRGSELSDREDNSNEWTLVHAAPTNDSTPVRWSAVAFSTGYGSAGAWELERVCETELLPNNASAAVVRICYSRPSALPEWSEYYRHYAHHRLGRYQRTVLLKMDDDTVYIDEGRFPAFINYRIRHPEPLLVLPNIINNAVAAYLQQSVQGVLPSSMIGQLKLEAGGALWESPQKSQALHRLFVEQPERFVHADDQLCYPLSPQQRVSINFFAVLTRHIDYFALVLRDGHEDEHQLTVDISSRFNLSKCVYPHLVVSHLSFGPQQSDERSTAQLIGWYDNMLLLGRQSIKDA